MDHAYSSAALFIKVAPAASRQQVVGKAGSERASSASPGAHQSACARPVVDGVTIKRSHGYSKVIRDWEDKKRASMRAMVERAQMASTEAQGSHITAVAERSSSTESDDTIMSPGPEPYDEETHK